MKEKNRNQTTPADLYTFTVRPYIGELIAVMAGASALAALFLLFALFGRSPKLTAYIFCPVCLFGFLIGLLALVRIRIAVDGSEIKFTPAFGRTRVFHERDLISVQFDGVNSALTIVMLHFENGGKAHMRYRSKNATLLLERFKDKLNLARRIERNRK